MSNIDYSKESPNVVAILDIIKILAEQKRRFTSDDIYAYVADHNVECDLSAIGNVFHRAPVYGLAVRTNDTVTSNRPQARGRKVAVWANPAEFGDTAAIVSAAAEPAQQQMTINRYMSNGVLNLPTGANKLSFEELEQCVTEAVTVRGELTKRLDYTNWIIGDLLIYAEANYPTSWPQLQALTGKTFQDLSNIKRVALAIPPQQRRPELPFSMHVEVAADKHSDKRDQLLEYAAQSGVSVRDFREHIAASKVAVRSAGNEERRDTRESSASGQPNGHDTHERIASATVKATSHDVYSFVTNNMDITEIRELRDRLNNFVHEFEPMIKQVIDITKSGQHAMS